MVATSWSWIERRRIWVALGIYVVVTAVYFCLAARSILWEHTRFNHFALLADSWLAGRLDLASGPPAYALRNDFALYDGRWHVVFPPFPALVLLPFVAWAGSAEKVADGQVFLWLAGVAPAVLFLVLVRVKQIGLSRSDPKSTLGLACLYAFGTVFFFCALQGTVWFAAHVVAAVAAAGYLYFALEARCPFRAGLLLGAATLTRPPLILAGVLFFWEVYRTALAARASPKDIRLALRKIARFLLPLLVVLVALGIYNRARFGSVFESGYRYLEIVWRARIETWGLMNYHYLPRNLGVLLTSLPYGPSPSDSVPFLINGHGLALWFTTPGYLWLLFPRRRTTTWCVVAVTALLVALPGLLYQNTGWIQFGARFSNDYAPLLFLLFALGGIRHKKLFLGAAVFAVLVNTFGAVSFDRPAYRPYYFLDPTQRILYQPD